ncbi:hypothetical protein [Xanthomonas citri]|uniref:hypothetical protein n=1 Tax=Xanthomonas citri TaxID=346 RepID=UPI001F1CFD8A|nr:hypothetical protein [Xanthomonas citri]
MTALTAGTSRRMKAVMIATMADGTVITKVEAEAQVKGVRAAGVVEVTGAIAVAVRITGITGVILGRPRVAIRAIAISARPRGMRLKNDARTAGMKTGKIVVSKVKVIRTSNVSAETKVSKIRTIDRGSDT